MGEISAVGNPTKENERRKIEKGWGSPLQTA